MQTYDESNAFRVAVAADKRTATLHLAAAFPRQMLNEAVCLGMIQGQGVKVTPYTREAVSRLLAEAQQQERDLQIVIARATEPVPGEDGRVEWAMAKDAGEAGQSELSDADQRAAQAVSHYERSAFTMVEAGQVLGKIIPPGDAVDGVDVLGNAIAAKEGKRATLDVDESVLCDKQGNIVAQINGVLVRHDLKLRIRKIIEINDHVDFSTGHIDFDGQVIVHKGVRDCFIVKATGDVVVKGLIEAATIICGGNLEAAGGFAGREQGKAEVAGDLIAKYLDNITAMIGGRLMLSHEAVNCTMAVNGDVDSPRAAIMGGRLTVTGTVEIGTLGSPAGVRTTIVLGQVPRLECFMEKLNPMLVELTNRRNRLLEEQQRIEHLGVRKTAHDKERQTEIIYELSTLNTRWQKARHAMDAMSDTVATRRMVNVSVQRMLNAGVCLVVQGRAYTIDQPISGPLRIFLDTNGQVVYKQGQQEAASLSQVARIKAA